MNLNCWKSVGFSEALPNGLLAAEKEKDEESPEKVDATGKPEEDLSESVAIPLYVKLLWCPVFEESMNSFSNPEDSEQKEYLGVDHLPTKRCGAERNKIYSQIAVVSPQLLWRTYRASIVGMIP